MSRAYLDPRSDAERNLDPWPGGVAIPLDQLRARQHELPPAWVPVPVGFMSDRVAVIENLASLGRAVEWVEHGGSKDPLWRASEFIIEAIATHVGPGARVADLGCGVGRDSIALATRGYAVTAVDHLADSIDRGREMETRYRHSGLSIDWMLADYRLPPSQPFEAVVLGWTFDRTAFKQILEWLTPGGLLVIETFCERSHDEFGHPTLLRCAFDKHHWPGVEMISYTEAEVAQKAAAQVLLRRSNTQF